MSRALVLSAGLLTASALLVPPLSTTAQSNTVDGNDFLMWQRSISVNQDEVVELSIEYLDPPGVTEEGQGCRLELSEKKGNVLGTVPLTFADSEARSTSVGSSRGFGFIEKLVSVEDGVLQVNGVAVAPLAPSPWTGRSTIGLSILCTKPPARATRQLSAIRWVIAGADSGTRAADGVDLNRNFDGHWGYDNEG